MKIFFMIFTIAITALGLHSVHSPTFAQGKSSMSIDQAYKLIPHQRTPYNAAQSTLADVEKRYLNHYFLVSDFATRSKMGALGYFYGQPYATTISQYNGEINYLISSFKTILTPTKFQNAENLLISALNDQKAFFNDWYKSKGTAKFNNLKNNYTRHRLVQSSHRKLYQAYSVILSNAPKETTYNKQAFFDHLCALDFI